MNGLNQMFQNDPVWFLKQRCVDNRTMQVGIEGANRIAQLNVTKTGLFDLVPASGRPGENKVTLVDASPGSNHTIVRDTPISALWCPYLSGGALPGFVDVPRASPPTRLILTAAMQGCAFVVTSSPLGAQYFRVFHNQHPEMSSTWAAITSAGCTNVISTLAYEQYEGGGMTNAFNLMWRAPKKSWAYVSQTNSFRPSAPVPGSRSYRPVIIVERNLGKPILDLPAGV